MKQTQSLRLSSVSMRQSDGSEQRHSDWSQLNVPGINTAIAGVQTATSSVQTFEGASSQDVSAVESALTLALGAVGTNINTNNTTVAASGNVAGVVAGAPPATLASNLTSQSDSFIALGQLYQVQSSLQRMFTNVGNGGS